jgi:GlpG protein
MRSIGQIIGADRARTLGNYLLFHGIESQIEGEAGGSFAVWIREEEQVEPARAILAGFLKNPDDPRFQVGAVRRPAPKSTRVFDRTNVFRASYSFGVGPLTAILIAVCAALFYLTYYGGRGDILAALAISDLSNPFNRLAGGGRLSDLSEIFHGQVWRLITPAFLHMGVMHILFNMLVFKDLGSLIEARLGSLTLLLLVLVLAAFSNLVQFFWAGPAFLGMSGVVYGLFGYIWIRGRYDTASGLFVHPSNVTLMIVWFFICWLPGMNIANGAHGGGLALGMAWGYLASGRLWK